MISIQKIREHKDDVIKRLAVKNFDAAGIISEVLEIDGARRSTQQELDSLLNESNLIAKQVGELMRSGKKAEADEMKSKSAALKETSKKLAEQLTALEKQ